MNEEHHTTKQDVPRAYPGRDAFHRVPLLSSLAPSDGERAGVRGNPLLEQVLRQTISELEMQVTQLQEQLGIWTEATSHEPHRCGICRKWFLRRRKVSNPKRICDSDKCRKIARLGKEKPVGFDGIPGTCSPLLADIRYHGRVMS